jgi:hypothetical protein
MEFVMVATGRRHIGRVPTTSGGARIPALDRAHRPRHPGADADSPTEIPGGGWRAIAKRVVTELKRDHVSLLAAGVTFKALLALFPAIIAAVTIRGLVASPEQMTRQLPGFLSALPADAAGLVEDQMTSVAEGGTGALSAALALSILLALWSASGGTAGLMEGTNAAYDEIPRPPRRGHGRHHTARLLAERLRPLGMRSGNTDPRPVRDDDRSSSSVRSLSGVAPGATAGRCRQPDPGIVRSAREHHVPPEEE